MKAGNKQRWLAADGPAQGQSLPARPCQAAPACSLECAAVPAPILKRGQLRGRFFHAHAAAILSCLLPLAFAPWAYGANPYPLPVHSSQPKPSAIHATAPPVQASRPMPSAQQHSAPIAPGHPNVGHPSGSLPTTPNYRDYAPGYAAPHTQVPSHVPAQSPKAYNHPGQPLLQPVRPGPYLAPNSAYGTLQAQSNLRQPFSSSNQQPRLTAQAGSGATGEHLGSWMKQHQNQSAPDQERSLRQEPGFDRLAPQQQQNLVNHLHQLNQMPPEQRQRTLSRIENMEHLSPERKQAVRSSAQQLGALPENRKRLVKKAFRDLRDLPPEQRQAIMNSPQFAGQFSAQERSIMGNLLVVEPYQHPGNNPQQTQNGR